MDSTPETVALLDGTRLLIRSPTPYDGNALLAFLRSLPSDSCRAGFVSPATDLEATARWAANPDGVDHLGIVALELSGRLVGHVACVRIYGLRGEVAVDVERGAGRHGLANLLLARIARDAKRQGIRTLIVEVSPPNDKLTAPLNS
jgi:hypothetical protein